MSALAHLFGQHLWRLVVELVDRYELHNVPLRRPPRAVCQFLVIAVQYDHAAAQMRWETMRTHDGHMVSYRVRLISAHSQASAHVIVMYVRNGYIS